MKTFCIFILFAFFAFAVPKAIDDAFDDDEQEPDEKFDEELEDLIIRELRKHPQQMKDIWGLGRFASRVVRYVPKLTPYIPAAIGIASMVGKKKKRELEREARRDMEE